MFSNQYIAETVLAPIGTSRKMIYFVIIEGKPGERNRERERERKTEKNRDGVCESRSKMLCTNGTYFYLAL